MFCYQCEQANKGVGCEHVGNCGKEPVAAELQDLLLYATQGISQYAHAARKMNAVDHEVDEFVIQALFTTVTNVNFDAARLHTWIEKAVNIRQRARLNYEKACQKIGEEPKTFSGPAVWEPESELQGLLAQAEALSIRTRRQAAGEEATGLQELILYGLKGTAAYVHHALVFAPLEANLLAEFHEILDFLSGQPTATDKLLAMALQVGELNFKVMAALDAAHTQTYGHPQPAKVRVTPVKGKAIVVSGHDLKDLEVLLQQTEGKGINIYTHGEMLPAHGYPQLKKYPHLVGNYGGAWQNQVREFGQFPGAILMTTNCIQKPAKVYHDRIFTRDLVGWPDVQHIADRDFSPVIAAALAAPGFLADEPEQTITVGFGHQAILSHAETIVNLVKSKKISHFYLIGGCDGAKPGRNYYTEFAQMTPKDSIIMTLACGKFRFNKLEFGDIEGIPRLLDVGQCNDAYSAIKVAVALASAFKTEVNQLPLSLILSWYEQKAVAILLTLLHLGIKGIHLGPSLPAFITPKILQFLVDQFAIRPIGDPKADLERIQPALVS